MIQDLLNKLRPVDVKKIVFDMKKGIIRVDLQDESMIQFEDVISFFYTDEEVSYQTHLDLKPIVYDAAGFDAQFTAYEDDWEEEDDFFTPYSVPNFSLCVDDRSMLIEAGKIKIGGSTYILTERMQ
ncbi:MAG TPA: hypothetical protein GXZ74_03435 [Tissierellia bacterium]|nr:hypothetical protein [Tissierellia bacterium]